MQDTAEDLFSITSLIRKGGWDQCVGTLMEQRSLERCAAVKVLAQGHLTIKGPGGTHIRGTRPAVLAARVIRGQTTKKDVTSLFRDIRETFAACPFPKEWDEGANLPTLGTLWLMAWVNHNAIDFQHFDRIDPHWPDQLMTQAGDKTHAPARLVTEASAAISTLAPASDPWMLRVSLGEALGNLFTAWDSEIWGNAPDRRDALHKVLSFGQVYAPVFSPTQEGAKAQSEFEKGVVYFWNNSPSIDHTLTRVLDTLAFMHQFKMAPEHVMSTLASLLDASAKVLPNEYVGERRDEGLAEHHPEVLAAMRKAKVSVVMPEDWVGRRPRPRS